MLRAMSLVYFIASHN